MALINLFLLIEPVTIALYVIGAVVIIVVVFLLLDRFVFIGRKEKRQVEELRRKYEYVHSLLIGQDSSYIKRLEIVSDINLLFRPIFEQFNEQYEALRDNNDRGAKRALEILEASMAKKKHRQFKEVYATQRVVIVNYESEVNALNRALEKVVQPETEARQAAVTEKEELRKIRAAYQLHKGELDPIDQSFRKVFDYVELTFAQYDQAVESANYEDAQQLLTKISRTLNSLDRVLETAPDLCVRAFNLIPQKLTDLEKSYQMLTDQKYPLSNLMVRTFLESSHNNLTDIYQKLKFLELTGINERLVAISDKIDATIIAFEKEKEHRLIFENEFEKSYAHVTELERKFIRLANTMPQIKAVYLIPQSNESKVEEIKAKINNISTTKRTLDTFIHSATRQPYSVLVEKLRHLQSLSQEATEELTAFAKYLESLKTGIEEAYAYINERYFKLKDAEAQLRDLNVPKYQDKHRLDFDQCYSNIERVDAIVHVQPIDVIEVASIVATLREQSENLLSEIESQVGLANLAENAIVYANNIRYSFSDVQKMLDQDEMLFFEGEFERAYIDAGNILKKYKNE